MPVTDGVIMGGGDLGVLYSYPPRDFFFKLEKYI